MPTPAFYTLAFLTVSHFPLPHFQSPPRPTAAAAVRVDEDDAVVRLACITQQGR